MLAPAVEKLSYQKLVTAKVVDTFDDQQKDATDRSEQATQLWEHIENGNDTPLEIHSIQWKLIGYRILELVFVR